MEDIRLDEDAVLKTAGANHASGFESVQDYSIEMALIRLVRGMPAKHAHLSSNLTSVSFVNGPSVQPGVDAALSRQRSPVQIRYGSLESNGVVRQRLSGLF